MSRSGHDPDDPEADPTYVPEEDDDDGDEPEAPPTRPSASASSAQSSLGGMGVTIPYHPAQWFCSGLSSDVDRLLKAVVRQFDSSETLRFQHFVDIWKDTKFALIFSSRESYRELYELTEELLDLVKRKTLSSASAAWSDDERVDEAETTAKRAAAIYALFAVYSVQPIAPNLRIQLTLDEYRDIVAFMDECRRDRHWDLVYVWNKLVQNRAFHFAATGCQMGFELAMSMDHRGSKQVSGSGFGFGFGADADDLVSQSDLFHLKRRANPFKTDLVQKQMAQISDIHSKYQAIKVALIDKHDPGHASLSLTSETLPEDLASLSETVYCTKGGGPLAASEATSATDGGDNDIGSRRKQLREKAFSSSGYVNKRKQRHLQHMKEDLAEADYLTGLRIEQDLAASSSSRGKRGRGRGRGRGKGKGKGRGRPPKTADNSPTKRQTHSNAAADATASSSASLTGLKIGVPTSKDDQLDLDLDLDQLASNIVSDASQAASKGKGRGKNTRQVKKEKMTPTKRTPSTNEPEGGDERPGKGAENDEEKLAPKKQRGRKRKPIPDLRPLEPEMGETGSSRPDTDGETGSGQPEQEVRGTESDRPKVTSPVKRPPGIKTVRVQKTKIGISGSSKKNEDDKEQ